MSLDRIRESFRRNGKVWFKRRGWNEEWVLTSSPIWDESRFEYKTVEEMQVLEEV